MIEPADLRLLAIARLRAEQLPFTPRLWPPAQGAARGHLEALQRLIQIASAVAGALLWLVGVLLLAQGLVGWWAELESLSRINGVVPASEFNQALE